MRFPMMAISVLAVAGGMFLGAGVAHAQTTWYVDGDGDVAGDCTSWADACPELQAALTLANPNDQIWVAVGIYKPDYDIIDGQHTGNRTATFQLINGVAIYGGFNGTETTLEDRAGLFDQTILSGDLNGDDEPDDFPFGPSYSENSYHVVAGGGTDRTAILDGFTITAGNANALPFPNESGGGMFNDGGSPTVSNCTFAGNFASYGGGMANIFGSSATVTNCTFSGNGAHFGGGMTNSSGSTPTVTNCTFSENWAGLYGGGMYNESGSPTVTNCTFSGNMSYHWGGGMSNLEGSNPTLTNCTFSGNSVFVGGGGMYNLNSSPTMTNCILWNNGSVQIEDGFGASTTVRYSDVQYGWPGEGNIDADPLFVDPDNENFHLLPGTPCIDAGDNKAVPSGVVTDLDGNLRFVDVTCADDSGNGTAPIVDMGPYENQFDFADCNDNGEPDICDIFDGTSRDCNFNGLPDDCEANEDCNDNGVPDLCDIIDGTSGDCNLNGIPDECEAPFPRVPCDDDDACTENDTCSKGVCNGTPVECDDANPCTDNSCDSSQGCVYPPNNDPCDDANACTTGDTCVNGGCVGSPPSSDDGLRYVDDDGVPDNCCTSWDDACRELQTALGLAESGNQIRVAAGIYKPDYDIYTGLHTGNRAATFQLISGVALRGGYLGLSAGPGDDPDERNIELHETILSGDLLGNDGPDLENNDENSWHVVTGSNVNDTATIEGFTLTAGNANGSPGPPRFHSAGGGMSVVLGSPTVNHCTLRGNQAVRGGGAFIVAGQAAWTNCVFSGNVANNYGGGVFQGSSFEGPEATFTNCAFVGNAAGGAGGGMYTGSGVGYPVLTNCVFTLNTSAKGGGLFAYESQSGLGVTVTNCLFIQNLANTDGGGFYAYHNSPTVTNSTFWENASSGSGGGIYATLEGSQLSVSNCILWGNNPNSITAVPLSEATVNYSDVQGGWSGPGANNIDADPLFVDPDGPDDIPGTQDDNLRLLPPSPAIDAADNTAVPSDSSDLDDDGDTDEPVPFDLDGTPRIVDVPCVSNSGNPPGAEAIVDMGAYEQEFAFNDCNDNGEDDICDLIDGISEDCNGNGVPDECQDTSADCNDNGIWDACDIAAGTSADCNGNGVPDVCDIFDGTSEDCNGNGVPDECGLDCNGNGVADSCDIAEGTSQDCNGNGVPDECDIAEGTGEDCNGNEIHDECDIADGTSEDCTGNGVPDECESDCNENGQADSCDIADGTSQDCGGEGIPDDCTENPGPVIFAQPVSQDAETGDFVLFAVGADGVLLEYQWRKDGENLVDDGRIFGAQSPGLIILDVEPADAGAYDCMVTDFAADCALSNPATLTVTDSCPADFDGDGTVGASDLAQLLGSWGPCDDCDNCSANFNEDCMVTAADLAQLLGDWGPCQ